MLSVSTLHRSYPVTDVLMLYTLLVFAAPPLLYLLGTGRTKTLERWVNAARSAGADAAVIDYVEAELNLRQGNFDKALALAGKSKWLVRQRTKTALHHPTGT